MKVQFIVRIQKAILSAVCFLFLMGFGKDASAQEQETAKYWVYFSDKKGTEFNPQEYFHPRAIERREKNGLPISDSLDFPVNEEYLSDIEAEALEITAISRWINAVCCSLFPSSVETIEKMEFVKRIEKVGGNIEKRIAKTGSGLDLSDLSDYGKRILKEQVESLNGQVFSQNKISGEGVRIAVFDVGFKGAIEHRTLAHLFENAQIARTYDFVKDREDVFHHSGHGTSVLACIAGVADSLQIGLAQGATFLLARTEYSILEPFSEEENWLEAMEWADKHGVDIINSSLGYSDKRYFETELDGETSLVSRAAEIAASKGILVINSAGNEGDRRWEYLVAPGDAENVLTVGGIDPETGIHAGFSSYGPTSDNRMKPNLCAYGIVVSASKKGGLQLTSGTSFSAPLITGFAACVMQKNPDWTSKQVFEELEKSGSLYPYFDYAHGYGVPSAAYFFGEVERNREKALALSIEGDHVNVEFLSDPGASFLYYQLLDEDDKVTDYAVMDPEGSNAIKLNLNKRTCLVKMSYRGEIYEIEVPCAE